MLQTNVAAVMEFTRAFAPPMVQRNRGHIVNISSVAGHEAYGGASLARVNTCLPTVQTGNSVPVEALFTCSTLQPCLDIQRICISRKCP